MHEEMKGKSPGAAYKRGFTGSLSFGGRGGAAGSVFTLFTLHACRRLDPVPAGDFYHLLFITCTQKHWSLLITLRNIARTFNSNNHLLGSSSIALCIPDSILRFLFQEQDQHFSDINIFLT